MGGRRRCHEHVRSGTLHAPARSAPLESKRRLVEYNLKKLWGVVLSRSDKHSAVHRNGVRSVCEQSMHAMREASGRSSLWSARGLTGCRRAR